MTSDAAGLLTLSQWLSPAFPVSAFAYSGGLEAAVASGAVSDEAAVSDWIGAVVVAGAARNDAILLCLALRGEMAHPALADLACALAGSAERWRETYEQGAAFARTLAEMGRTLPAAPYPVALGIAARDLGLPDTLVAQLFLQAQVANLVSAAIRLVPLGQAAGQRIIAGLGEQIARVAAEAVVAGPDDLGSATLGAELAALEHETLPVRLFRS
ncbi:MAG: urease accessory UreF family protein [Pseudomonadota bacterium]